MARPRKDINNRRETISVRLPNWILDWMLRKEESSGKIIEDALVQTHKLEQPKSE